MRTVSKFLKDETMQKNNSKYFDPEGHLNTVGRSVYADAMKLEKVEQLPLNLQEHVGQCSYCSSLIILLYDAIQDIAYEEASPHPLFKTLPKSKWTLGNRPQDIETILTQLRKEAIEIPSMERLIQRGEVFRGQNHSQPLLLTPHLEQLCLHQIDFEFTQPIGVAADLSIRNHQKRVFKGQIPAHTTHFTVSFQPKVQFPNGLYYWKMVLKGGSPIAGKFYVYQV